MIFVFARGHVLPRTSAASVICPSWSLVLCHWTRQRLGIFPASIQSTLKALFLKAWMTIACCFRESFPVCTDPVTGFLCRLLCQTPLLVTHCSAEKNDADADVDHTVRLLSFAAAVIYLGAYQCWIQCVINQKRCCTPSSLKVLSFTENSLIRWLGRKHCQR